MTEHDQSPQRQFEVRVGINATVRAPVGMVPEHLSKRLYHWPDELLEHLADQWCARTGLDRAVFDASDDIEIVEVSEVDGLPPAQPSTT